MQGEGLFRGLAEPRTLIVNAIDEEAQLSAVARRSVPLDARPMAHIGTALEMAQGAVESLVAKPSVGIRTQPCANGEGLLAALAEHK